VAERPERPGRSERPRREGDQSDRAARSERPRRDGAAGRAPKREDGPTGRASRSEADRPEWQRRVARERKVEKSPLIPSEITPEDLEYGVRVQLKTLTPENADMVARHLAMVSLLIDDDPKLAHKHAVAAAYRAGRLALVHETVGITAYAIGDFSLALRELLTHRRLTGSNDQLPLIIDSERGLGRPERGLQAANGVDRKTLEPGVRINLAIALSGARLDLGQTQEALEELEIAELTPKRVLPQSPLLFRSYAECLREVGRDGSEWDSLADRAEFALQNVNGEEIRLLEEIHIPTSEEFERKPRASGDREFKPRTPRDGDRDRKPRATGDREFKPRAPRDGDREFKPRAPRDAERTSKPRLDRLGDRKPRSPRTSDRNDRGTRGKESDR
jgi:23S rRNA pseudouridine2605 synthase